MFRTRQSRADERTNVAYKFRRIKATHSSTIGHTNVHETGRVSANHPDSTSTMLHFKSTDKLLDASYGDRQRVEARFRRAVAQLQSCFGRQFTITDAGQFRELLGINQIHSLRGKIDEILESRQAPTQNRNIFDRIFKALFPFAKNLLTLAIQSQPVPQTFLRLANFNSR